MGELKSDLLAAKQEIAAFQNAKKETVRLSFKICFSGIFLYLPMHP